MKKTFNNGLVNGSKLSSSHQRWNVGEDLTKIKNLSFITRFFMNKNIYIKFLEYLFKSFDSSY